MSTHGLGILKGVVVAPSIPGCTNPIATNYDPTATVDDGSCQLGVVVMGCMVPTAQNYNPVATTENGMCMFTGCTDTTAFNYNANDFNDAYAYSTTPFIIDDGSCIPTVQGCTNSLAFNYDPLANVDDGSCVVTVSGCSVVGASNYDSSVNTDDGSCTWYGCTNPVATNFISFGNNAVNYVASAGAGIIDDGSCLGSGCMDNSATNYDPSATYDDLNLNAPDYSSTNGSCVFCDWSANQSNAYSGIPVVTLVLDDDPNNTIGDGQIAVATDLTAPYQPFTFTLTNSSGVTVWTQTANQTLGGVVTSDSTLFSGLPADDYTVTVQGSGSASSCVYTTNIVTVGSGTLLTPGCTDTTACNYDTNATADDGSCEWTTCAGCMDPTANGNGSSSGFGANGTQTSTSTPCTIGGTGITGPCVIACGDGNNNTSQGNYCCDYHVFGCDDPTMFNYYYGTGNTPPPNTTVINDGSCIAITYGCTAPSATNYDPLATTDDGSCTYPPLVPGCSDPNACNYDPFANTPVTAETPCLYSLSNVTLGQTDGGILGPAFYNVVGAHTFTAGMSSTSQTGRTSKKVRHMVVNDWPLSSVGQSDMGLSYQYNGPFSYSQFPPNSLKVRIDRKVDPTDPNSAWNNNIQMKDFGGVLGSGGLLGVRNYNGTTTNFPFPWGPAQNAGSNYEFDVWFNNTTKHIYRLRLFQNHTMGTNPTQNFGDSNSTNPYPACGVSQVFEIQDLPCSDSPFSQLGCTDPSACNYDTYATCDDGSCYYTTQNYYTPDPTGASGCFACDVAGSGCGTALPNCPTFYNGSQFVPHYYQSGCTPVNPYDPTTTPFIMGSCGNVYDDLAECNATAGANFTGGGGG